MPKKLANALSLNLLPGKEAGFGEKFLEWSLTFGRYIIIGTEIIVLVAFLSRFKLDRDYIDLNDKIKEQQKILENYKPVEQNVNSLQARLAAISTIEAGHAIGLSALSKLALITPPEITFQDIIVTKDKITIAAAAAETPDISRYVAILRVSELFNKDSIVLERVERKDATSNISFAVSANVEKR